MNEDFELHSLWIERPGQAGLRQEQLSLAPNQLLVRTLANAVSHGSERLVFSGDAPAGAPLDTQLESLNGLIEYPLKYGYAAVGEVVTGGSETDADWIGQRVFSFQPHQSAFAATKDQLIKLPASLSPEQAAFLPHVETAVSLVQDAAPHLGETISVHGLGLIGLLTLSLLARMSPRRLIAIDPVQSRREAASQRGASHALAPGDEAGLQAACSATAGESGVDIAIEVSGTIAGLQQAIDLAGYDGRIVAGSWYPESTAQLQLGTHFHRQRLQITASQVSTLAPALRGRWTKQRRLSLALDLLPELDVGSLISHRIAFADSPQMYALLSQPAACLGIVLTHV